ncbi:hypothetical protein BC938DRAFT_479808 [Jimgerdemannia flammicorona]|uniref:Uncharacterized protein n=1 Tax=Jimgerdemannia flammicorona TaxID=994334 RepID=A0A433QK34_9FUNG|nr:hypothetical protein BC938DRAFT_479808 [Jimgerdemannia flammicorona]
MNGLCATGVRIQHHFRQQISGMKLTCRYRERRHRHYRTPSSTPYLINSKRTLNTAGEFHHLLGLDVLQTIDTGNTVTNGQHTTSFLDIGI